MSMQQAQKEMQSPTEGQIAMMAIQEKAKVDAATISIKERDAETKFLELMSKIQSESVQNEIKLAEIDAENTRSAVDSAINISKHINEQKQGEIDHGREMDTGRH